MIVDEAINIVGSYFALGTIGQALTEADHAHACWQELCRLVRLGELVENMPRGWILEAPRVEDWHVSRNRDEFEQGLIVGEATTPAEALKAAREGKK